MDSVAVGDLEMVARWSHRHGERMLGWIVAVVAFRHPTACQGCGCKLCTPTAVFKHFSIVILNTLATAPIAWLRGIRTTQWIGIANGTREQSADKKPRSC